MYPHINKNNRLSTVCFSLAFAIPLVLSPSAWSRTADPADTCMHRALKQAGDHLTIGEIRLACTQDSDTSFAPENQSTEKRSDKETDKAAANPSIIAVREKRELEMLAAENPYGISPHKRNYLLPVSYNRRPNGKPFEKDDQELDQAEVKFQFSYKVPLIKEIMQQPLDLFFAYTNQSYWQAYNGTVSRPFRETNHEPEFFLTWTNPWEPIWVEQAQYSLGLSHQSNGRSGELSRSWNRFYVSTLLQNRHYYLGLKLWDRISEDPKDFPGDPRGDDNPDIEKFYGHFELELSRVKQFRSLSILIRNNLRRDDNFGAVRLAYSFPLSKTLRGYMEYFEGYGESLIDYNHDAQRIGLGIAISDWP